MEDDEVGESEVESEAGNSGSGSDDAEIHEFPEYSSPEGVRLLFS